MPPPRDRTPQRAPARAGCPMSRRTRAGVAAVALLIATWLVATLVPTNYVVYSPGPTVNLLAKEKGGDLVRVSGAKAYRDKGALRLLTVVPTGPDDRVYLAEAMFAWLNPKQAVYRESDIYQPQENSDRVEAESAVDMVNSQDSAIASALHELGYKFGTSVQILGVTRGGPGDGALEVHDKILSVDGARTTTLEAVVDRIRKVSPGDEVALRIQRRNKKETVKVKTVASEDDPKSSALQVTVGRGYEFPVKVSLKISSLIGGPSAGTMFALAIYDTLTPGSLTDGGDVAGTGEIDGDGHVGGIGGIQQKLVAAQSDGATLFLAPASNCDEVKGGPQPGQDAGRKISTLDDAIKAVEAWRKNPDAKLPSAERRGDHPHPRFGGARDRGARRRVGWDRSASLYALVPTAELVVAEPALADAIGLSTDSRGFTPIDQELPADTVLEDALGKIMWPDGVVGCAAVVERLVLPPSADEHIPEDREARRRTQRSIPSARSCAWWAPCCATARRGAPTDSGATTTPRRSSPGRILCPPS